MAEKTYHHGDLKNALIQAGVEILAKEGVALRDGDLWRYNHERAKDGGTIF